MMSIINRLTQLGLTADDSAVDFELRDETSPNAMADDDRTLLRRYIDTGSEEAFSQIVYRHAGWIYHTCRRSLRDSHLAEDAAQAVFLLLSKKASSIEPTVHLGGWLFQACRYVLADLRKHHARYRRRQDLACELTMQRFAAAESTIPSTDPALSAALDQAIAGLRESDRQTILMHFYEGLTLRQMAEQLSIGREGAKKRVMRALSRLRKQLAAKIDPARKGAIIPVAAFLALLRTRSVEAAPLDFVAAVAKSAAIPGLSSTLAEVLVEGVRQSAVRASTRLMARLTLATTALSMLIMATLPLRSHHDGSRSAMLGDLWSYVTQRTQPFGVKEAAVPSPDISPGWTRDDAITGRPYQQPPEAPAAPLADLGDLVEQSKAVPSSTGMIAGSHSPAQVPTSVTPSFTGTSPVTIPAFPAMTPPAISHRFPEQFGLSEPMVVVQMVPATGSLVARPHLSADPYDIGDHRQTEPADARPGHQSPEFHPPMSPADALPGRHWPDPDAMNPHGTPPPALAAGKSAPPPVQTRQEVPGENRPWEARPMSMGVAPMFIPSATSPPCEHRHTSESMLRPPMMYAVYSEGSSDGVVSFVMAGGRPGSSVDGGWPILADWRSVGRNDPLPAEVMAGIAPTAKWSGMDDGHEDLGGFGDNRPYFAWANGVPGGNGDGSYGMMTDALIVPEPTGAIAFLCLVGVLASCTRDVGRRSHRL